MSVLQERGNNLADDEYRYNNPDHAINDINEEESYLPQKGKELDDLIRKINKKGELSNNIAGIDYKQYEDYISGKIDSKLYNDFIDINVDNPNFKTTGLYTSDKFWLEDPMVLFRNGNFYRIIPSRKMSKIEVLNSLTRFFLYVLILYLIFSKKREYIYVPVIAIMVIVLIYYIQRGDVRDQKIEKVCRQGFCNNVQVCQRPTEGNPFMNVTVADLMDNRDRPAGCISTDKQINREINRNFNNNLMKDVDDVYNRGYSQRQFYTMPSTTIPNDQGAFAKFLYNLRETCKENQNNCLLYEDIRFQRYNPNVDTMERIVTD